MLSWDLAGRRRSACVGGSRESADGSGYGSQDSKPREFDGVTAFDTVEEVIVEAKRRERKSRMVDGDLWGFAEAQGMWMWSWRWWSSVV